MNTKIKDSKDKCICSCLGGFGTFLIGIGAIIAAWQTSDVLEEILSIKEMVRSVELGNEKIQQGNDQLQKGNDQLQKAILELNNLIKSELTKTLSKQTVQTTALKDNNISLEQVNQSLENVPEKPICSTNSVYLPRDIKDGIASELQKATPQQREIILEKALKYQPADAKNCDIGKFQDGGN